MARPLASGWRRRPNRPGNWRSPKETVARPAPVSVRPVRPNCARSSSQDFSSGSVLSSSRPSGPINTNSAPERPLICSSTGLVSGKAASASVLFTRRKSSACSRRTRRAIHEAVIAVANKLANKTTETIGTSNWRRMGHLMPEGSPERATAIRSVVAEDMATGPGCRKNRHRCRATRHETYCTRSSRETQHPRRERDKSIGTRLGGLGPRFASPWGKLKTATQSL